MGALDALVTMTVPDPEARGPVRGRIGAVLFFGAIAVVGSMDIQAHLGLGTDALLIAAPPLISLALMIFAITGPSRVLHLRRRGASILGLPGGALPAGVGRVVVERHDGSVQFGGPQDHYTVDLIGPNATRRLVRRGTPATRVRALAEGLCRFGGWTLVWRSAGGEEVLAPADLDRSLAERSATTRQIDDDRTTPSPIPIHHRPGGGVEIQSPGMWLPRKGILLLAGFVATPLVALAIVAPKVLPFVWAIGGATLVTAGLLTIALLLIMDRALRFVFVADLEGVEARLDFAGMRGRGQRVTSKELKSLYVDGSRGRYFLVLSGDGIHVPAGRFTTLDEAAAARGAMVAALSDR